MNIINLSDLSTSWNWLKDEFKHNNNAWSHYSSLSVNVPKYLPKPESIARTITALRAVYKARQAKSLLVSHGPRPALYGASIAKVCCPALPHLVYSFNFTHLPIGTQHKLMAKAFQQPTKFVSYSTVERSLYAQYFDIPIERIDMLHWAVHAPKIDLTELPLESGRYICALGSQGRDYKTLFAAMKNLPNIKLVVVTNAESIKDLSIPANVKIYTNIPNSQANNILAHSQFMALPLRDSQVPCGHVTIVSAMFYSKAIVATNSQGVHDYIEDEQTGLFFEPQNVDDLTLKIQSLWEEPIKTAQLAQNGFAFAHAHCTEKTVVHYFSEFLKTL
jgi:glycosyltransferase involved in cell wall biosynthesis